MAMVFQNYALYPAHDASSRTSGSGSSCAARRRTRSSAACDDVARTLYLEPLLERKPAALSGGQRQRVAMGRAMVREPVAFLMDEPLSNLDAKLRVEMRAELARLRDRLKTTTLYVTHDQVEAMTLGRPRRRPEGRRPAAGRHAAAAVQRAGEPVRRGVHRLTVDEPGGRARRGRRRALRRRTRSRCRPSRG